MTDTTGQRARGPLAERTRVVRRVLYGLALVWVAVGSMLYAIEVVNILSAHG